MNYEEAKNSFCGKFVCIRTTIEPTVPLLGILWLSQKGILVSGPGYIEGRLNSIPLHLFLNIYTDWEKYEFIRLEEISSIQVADMNAIDEDVIDQINGTTRQAEPLMLQLGYIRSPHAVIKDVQEDRYPHKCPNCGSSAYVGCFEVDCSNTSCSNY